MKYSMKIRKSILGAAIAFVLIPQGFAEAQTNAIPVSIAGFTPDGVTLMMQIYQEVIYTVYNKAIQTTADLIYENDTQLPAAITDNKLLADNTKTVQDAMFTASNTQVANAFSSLTEKATVQKELGKIVALDDVLPSAGGTNMFGISTGGDQDAINKEAQKNNAMFNAESLIGYDAYDIKDNDTHKQENAMNYLSQIENAATLPPIIKLASVFDVPFEDQDNPNNDTVTLGVDKPIPQQDLTKMRQILQTSPAYTEYKNKFRMMVALRSFYVNILEQIYHDRIVTPATQDGKSIEQIKNEAVNKRLTREYYTSMATAAPATVSREQLVLLTQISSQLNEIRKQNQQIMLMNALNGLNKLSTDSAAMDGQAKQVGAVVVSVYCSLGDNKTSIDLCRKQAAQKGTP
jgi:hypothetical protein